MTLLEKVLINYARHFPIRLGKYRLINALWRTAAGAGPFDRMALLNRSGMCMPCDVSELLQRQFYYFGTYFLEDEILSCWETAAKRADVIFDVGANMGIYSLTALAANSGATVHAFEPTPEIAARLRNTAAMNNLRRLIVNELAVADWNGQAALQRCRGGDGSNGGMNYITSNDLEKTSEAVAVVSLDSYCTDRGIDRIDLIKLDIQGMEYSALVGAGRLFKTSKIGTLFIELNWAGHGATFCPATELVRLLDSAGYKFSKPAKKLTWCGPGDWLRAHRDIVAQRSNLLR